MNAEITVSFVQMPYELYRFAADVMIDLIRATSRLIEVTQDQGVATATELNNCKEAVAYANYALNAS
jgi:hypothetical protein